MSCNCDVLRDDVANMRETVKLLDRKINRLEQLLSQQTRNNCTTQVLVASPSSLLIPTSRPQSENQNHFGKSKLLLERSKILLRDEVLGKMSKKKFTLSTLKEMKTLSTKPPSRFVRKIISDSGYVIEEEPDDDDNW